MQKITRRRFAARGASLAGLGAASRLIAAPLREMFAQDAGASNPSDPSEQLRILLEKMGGSGGYFRAQTSPLTAESFAQELARTQELIGQLNAIDRSRLTKDESIDLRYAESILWGRQIEQAETMRWKKDPRVYLQFHSLSTLMALPNPDAARGQQVIESLQSIPARLTNGQANLEMCIPRFRELSIFMIDNLISVFRDDVPVFAAKVPEAKAGILQANDKALAAVLDYQKFVREALPKKPVVDFAIGRRVYDLMLSKQYLLDYNADTLYAFAWSQFEETVKQAEAVAKTIDPTKSWLEVAANIKNDGPNPEKIIEAHQEWVDKARAHVIAHGIVPIPWKERVDVVPRAEYLRKTSYYGNFSGARTPDKDGVLVGQWQINTFLSSWSEEEKKQYMVEHDWGVIIDTAPHETYCGHHIQMLYQLHNPSKFRRSSSISIFSEGWGLYVERLMQETGFFPNEGIHLRNLQLRLWRIARVIWDVGMNTGKLSYDEAVNLLIEKVGFQRWAAELEVDYAAEHPGYQLGYFMGYSGIVGMRTEFQKIRGDKFSYSDFHERLLKVGCMPPNLMREGLLNSLV